MLVLMMSKVNIVAYDEVTTVVLVDVDVFAADEVAECRV